MKKFLGISALLIAMTLPALAQWQQNRMSSEDQSKFDSYYSHWMEARQKNDRSEIVSQEKRMQNLMSRYGIPQDVPYDRIVSNGGGYGEGNSRNYDRDGDRDRDNDHDRDRYRNNGYQGTRLSADDQRKFDSYYAHWMDARQKHDGNEIVSAEKRMQNLMSHYGIPQSVPYDRIASQGQNYR